MIAVGEALVSEEVLSEKFVCDLGACKGECCIAGVSGAPLEKDEVDILEKILPKVKPYMTPAGIKAVDEQGVFVLDMYGSLVNSIKKSKVKGIQVDFENIYLLEEDYITIINLETNKEVKIACPFKNIIEFRKNSQHFFLRTNTEIKKYQLLFEK